MSIRCWDVGHRTRELSPQILLVFGYVEGSNYTSSHSGPLECIVVFGLICLGICRFSLLLPAARSNMSSTNQEQVGGTGIEQMRDEEHCATLTAAVRSKILEVARNGFAGATAGGGLRACSQVTMANTLCHCLHSHVGLGITSESSTGAVTALWCFYLRGGAGAPVSPVSKFRNGWTSHASSHCCCRAEASSIQQNRGW